MRPFSRKLDAKNKFLRLLGRAGNYKGLKAGLMLLKPGEGVGEHSTAGREEAIIILRGQARVRLRGRRCLNAAKGSFVYIPPRQAHNLENAGRGQLRYVYITG
jgi:mannose-6-phosphate isomerase-like protein (cupin superfamily)